MRIVGGILPFVGVREIFVDDYGLPAEVKTQWKANALEVEWLNHGLVLMIFNVWSER